MQQSAHYYDVFVTTMPYPTTTALCGYMIHDHHPIIIVGSI